MSQCHNVTKLVFPKDLNIFAACGSMFENSMCKLGKKSVNKKKR